MGLLKKKPQPLKFNYWVKPKDESTVYVSSVEYDVSRGPHGRYQHIISGYLSATSMLVCCTHYNNTSTTKSPDASYRDVIINSWVLA